MVIGGWFCDPKAEPQKWYDFLSQTTAHAGQLRANLTASVYPTITYRPVLHTFSGLRNDHPSLSNDSLPVLFPEGDVEPLLFSRVRV